MDRSGVEDPTSGDIVVTVMVYLNDMEGSEAGGTTSYPMAQPEPVVVRPKLGTAVVWFSCTTEGLTDKLSYHRGRQVLKGEKWILNKFVYGTVDRCSWSPKFPKEIKYVL